MLYVIYCLAAILTLFLWNVIHEMSHVLAAKIFGNVKEWSIKPYPHKHNGKFRFAGAYWTWDGDSPANGVRGCIDLAPRIMNVVAIELLIVALFISGPAQILLLIFCAGGIIDLFVGSIGYSDNSDLQKAAKRLEIHPWKIRIAGFLFCLLGVLATVASLLA
ncbi:MAG: hypothetical protein ACXADB_00050 [Candidatus Hermodarchaeia archaeon]|jgi:hypothetical protein